MTRALVTVRISRHWLAWRIAVRTRGGWTHGFVIDPDDGSSEWEMLALGQVARMLDREVKRREEKRR